MMAERIINVNDTEQIINLFGTYDENINMIQRQYDVVVLSRGTDIKISGSGLFFNYLIIKSKYLFCKLCKNAFLQYMFKTIIP